MSFVSRFLTEVQPASKLSFSSQEEDVVKEVISDPSNMPIHETDEQAPAATGGAPIEAGAFVFTLSANVLLQTPNETIAMPQQLLLW